MKINEYIRLLEIYDIIGYNSNSQIKPIINYIEEIIKNIKLSDKEENKYYLFDKLVVVTAGKYITIDRYFIWNRCNTWNSVGLEDKYEIIKYLLNKYLNINCNDTLIVQSILSGIDQ